MNSFQKGTKIFAFLLGFLLIFANLPVNVLAETTAVAAEETSENDGTSFETALTTLSLGTTVKATISNDGDSVYYKIVPDSTGTYTFSSVGNYSVCGYLYDADEVELANNDSGGIDSNFKITYDLTAGETYYLKVYFKYSGTTGSFTVAMSDFYAKAGESVTILDELLGEVSFTAGESATLSVEADSVFGITYQWYVYNVAKGKYEKLTGETGATLEVATSPNRYCIVSDGYNEEQIVFW